MKTAIEYAQEKVDDIEIVEGKRRCRDAPDWWATWDNLVAREYMFAKALLALREDTRPRDRNKESPPVEEFYIVWNATDKDDPGEIVYWDGEKFRNETFDQYVTHWMPRPKHPEGGG